MLILCCTATSHVVSLDTASGEVEVGQIHHVKRVASRFPRTRSPVVSRTLTTPTALCARWTYAPLPLIMEDTTMLDDSKGLFGEHSFTIIPNGLSEDRLDQVSAIRIYHKSSVLTRLIAAKRYRRRGWDHNTLRSLQRAYRPARRDQLHCLCHVRLPRLLSRARPYDTRCKAGLD